MRQWQMALLQISIIAITITITFLGIELYKNITYEPTVPNEYIFIGDLQRMQANQFVEYDLGFFIEQLAIKEGVDDYIISTIITESRKAEVPINITLALAYAESRFKPEAKNKNADGTYDYGVMQLNSGTFPDMKKNLPVDMNVAAGIGHLKFLYDKYGSWEVALIAYNCGRPERFNPITAKHLINILTKEKEYDVWFKDMSERYIYSRIEGSSYRDIGIPVRTIVIEEKK